MLQRRVVLDEERIANYIEGLVAENNAASTDEVTILAVMRLTTLLLVMLLPKVAFLRG